MKLFKVSIFVLFLSACRIGQPLPVEGDEIQIYIQSSYLETQQVYNFDRIFVPGKSETQKDVIWQPNCVMKKSELPMIKKWQPVDTDPSIGYVSFLVDEKGKVFHFWKGEFFVDGQQYSSGLLGFEEKLAEKCNKS